MFSGKECSMVGSKEPKDLSASITQCHGDVATQTHIFKTLQRLNSLNSGAENGLVPSSWRRHREMSSAKTMRTEENLSEGLWKGWRTMWALWGGSWRWGLRCGPLIISCFTDKTGMVLHSKWGETHSKWGETKPKPAPEHPSALFPLQWGQ